MSGAVRATPSLDARIRHARAREKVPGSPGNGGVLSSGVRASWRPQRTDGDHTAPVTSPSWVADPAPVPTGDTGAERPSASSLHRGTERAGYEVRTRNAPRSAQAA